MKRRRWWSNTRVPRWRRAILFLDAKTSFRHSVQVGAIVGESRKALSNGWKRILPVETNWCFVARTSSWPPGDERAYIYIYTWFLTDREFRQSIIWNSRVRGEVMIFEEYKRDELEIKRYYYRRNNRNGYFYPLCHFLDNLIDSNNKILRKPIESPIGNWRNR